MIDYATFSYSQDQDNVNLLDAIATLQTEGEEKSLSTLYDLGKKYEWSKPHIQLTKEKQKDIVIDKKYYQRRAVSINF